MKKLNKLFTLFLFVNIFNVQRAQAHDMQAYARTAAMISGGVLAANGLYFIAKKKNNWTDRVVTTTTGASLMSTGAALVYFGNVLKSTTHWNNTLLKIIRFCNENLDQGTLAMQAMR